jgi:single-stranded DNA-specific DHH superfamily exonuclease
MFYDVFNGDADGICSLLQLRLHEPRNSQLITGIKRDIDLLKQINPLAGDHITVLDVSLDKNREALNDALQHGASVFYVDHHFSGDIPTHPNLHALINTRPEVCTSVLVNAHLRGQFQAWAVVGAYGDNLDRVACELADQLSLDSTQREQLSLLGNCINYNAYGESRDDLHYQPEDIFRRALPFENPLDFIKAETEFFSHLTEGYREDLAKAQALQPIRADEKIAVFYLPADAWARRVSGVYGNDLSNDYPQRAHALLTPKTNGNFLVSVRAPKVNKSGADEVCRQFISGGGRAGAAGINDLLPADVERFIETFAKHYSQ